MLTNESSLRLYLLRFPLIVCIVFMHSYDTNVAFYGRTIVASQNSFITELVRYLISQGITRTAVPLFFLMSGYLFFAGFVWSKENYIGKIKSRIRTLLIPFLFWNITTLLFILVAQTLPATQSYFSGKNPLIASFSSIDYLCAILGIGRNPVSYQFWFVRDLMLLALFTPIIYYLNKTVPRLYLSVLFICWYFNIWPISAPSGEAALFFSAGGCWASTGRTLFFLDKYGKVMIVAYVFAVILEAIFIEERNHYLQRIGVLIGLPAVLFATKFVFNSQRLKQAVLSLGNASFFVYAAHEPLLTVARKVTYKIIQPDSSYLILTLYIIIPTIVIILLVVVFRILSCYFKKFTHIITGGRTTRTRFSHNTLNPVCP